jgi:hypothetical protein
MNSEIDKKKFIIKKIRKIKKLPYEILFFFVALLFLKVVFIDATTVSLSANFQLFQIISTLSNIKQILSQIGPMISAVLFIIAGIFYALGQLLPPEKKAQFHTTAINVIIGAIVIAVLSFTATSLTNASTHLLSNFTTNAVNNTL